MCILAGIGTAIAGTLGATVGTAAAATGVAGVITAGTATAIGAGAVGLGALAAGGIGAAIANGTANARSSKSIDLSALNYGTSLSADASNKTASKLQDNTTEKRTISSLRIPLRQKNNTANLGTNTADTKVGLNIPM